MDDPHDETIAMPSRITTDDEVDDDVTPSQPTTKHRTTWEAPPTTPPQAAQPTPVDFTLNGPPMPTSEGARKGNPTTNVNVILDEEDQQKGSDCKDLAELLRIHHQYGHIFMRNSRRWRDRASSPKG